MGQISGDWQAALKNEFHQPYYAKLYKTVMTEYRTRKIFPPPEDLFNAFHFTPLHQVKVVILGQDPYHNDGQAHGLCFSVKKGVETPPSLVNIYKELEDDMGCYIPNNGNLEKWAKQGVLLLNTVLTVRAHQANSHRGIGWEQFTDAAIRILPNGYDTVYTDGMFSQGEWQLLSIARAAAADPAVLLLDEITANLDAETEARVLEALRRASEGRTVLSISHRIYENLGGRTVEVRTQTR